MHELKKPLTDVCEIQEHVKTVFRMIWKCKIQPTEDRGSLDGRIIFPNKGTKDTLFFVFEQVGRDDEPEAVSKEPVSEEAVAEDAVEDADAIEEEELDDLHEDLRQPNQPFFGIQRPRDTGFFTISLNDPATKFAVSISPHLFRFYHSAPADTAIYNSY